jgi:hypothetical protein
LFRRPNIERHGGDVDRSEVIAKLVRIEASPDPLPEEGRELAHAIGGPERNESDE